MEKTKKSEELEFVGLEKDGVGLKRGQGWFGGGGGIAKGVGRDGR